MNVYGRENDRFSLPDTLKLYLSAEKPQAL